MSAPLEADRSAPPRALHADATAEVSRPARPGSPEVPGLDETRRDDHEDLPDGREVIRPAHPGNPEVRGLGETRRDDHEDLHGGRPEGHPVESRCHEESPARVRASRRDPPGESPAQARAARRVARGLVLEHAVGHHVTMRLVDDRVIASTPAALRAAAQVLLARGAERGLLTFGIADTHVHVVLACSRAAAGAFARAAETALRLRLGLPVPFEAARIRPIVDQRHLGHAARYALRQDVRHGTRTDELRDGTALPDLLGLRVVDPDLATRFAARLPRHHSEDLLPLLGVEVAFGPASAGPGGESAPLAQGGVEPWGWLEPIADAAAAALALPDLDGQDAMRTAARRAAIHVALGAGARTGRVADLIRVSRRAVQRLAATPALPALVRAVELQLRLRAALARR